MRIPGEKRQINRLRWLNYAIAALALLAYLLYLTGDYFLPVKGGFWLVAVVILLLGGVIARYYLGDKTRLDKLDVWLVENWTVWVLGLALVLGGMLRLQALNETLPPGHLDFASASMKVINESNWQPASFTQPPLYLYLGAGMVELNFIQQASQGKINSPELVQASAVSDSLQYVNLALGLFALIPVYAAASRLWNSRREGAVAALLLATSWLAYQATPFLVPQTLAAALATSSFYFMVRGWQEREKGSFWWAGLLAGFATAAAYGSALLLAPLTLAALWKSPAEGPQPQGKGFLWRGWLGWLFGFTLAAPGWILSLNLFISGITSIGNAPANAGGFYLKQALTRDAGLAIASLIAFVLAFWQGGNGRAKWLVLAFPLCYAVILNLFGPTQTERLALIAPFLAIAAAFPVGLISQKVQDILNAQDGRHRWAGGALATGLAILLFLVAIVVRRLYP